MEAVSLKESHGTVEPQHPFLRYLWTVVSLRKSMGQQCLGSHPYVTCQGTNGVGPDLDLPIPPHCLTEEKVPSFQGWATPPPLLPSYKPDLSAREIRVHCYCQLLLSSCQALLGRGLSEGPELPNTSRRHLGRSPGFPDLNLSLCHPLQVPRGGDFAMQEFSITS